MRFTTGIKEPRQALDDDAAKSAKELWMVGKAYQKQNPDIGRPTEFVPKIPIQFIRRGS
jgi:hypothetical protein